MIIDISIKYQSLIYFLNDNNLNQNFNILINKKTIQIIVHLQAIWFVIHIKLEMLFLSNLY